MTIGIILQARTGSTRLPRKILNEIQGETLLNRCFSNMLRLGDSKLKLYLATTTLEEDKILVPIAKAFGITAFCGNPTDLIHRFYSIAQQDGLSVICRLTGDNPFIDYKFILHSLKCFNDQNLDFPTIATSRGGSLAPGLDVETFNISALKKTESQANSVDREHITTGMTEERGFKVLRLKGRQIHSEYTRLTVDLPIDLEIANDYALKFDLNHRSVDNFETGVS